MISAAVLLAAHLTAATPEAVVASPIAKEPRLPPIGVLLDAGVPDGAGISLVVRPLSWLRLHGGMTYNDIAPGLRVGASWVPFQSVVAPTFTVEYGHVFEGNANGLARFILGDGTFNSAYLDRLNYDYVNGHLGIELGSQRRILGYLHLGLSHVWGTVSSFGDGLQKSTDTSVTATPLHATANVPSAKIGLIVYF